VARRKDFRLRAAPAPGRVAAAIGVDTGGTFTDFVARAGGQVVTIKKRSTPRAPEQAVLAGLGALGAARATPVRHGSTVATNALLERKGARVALVTTAGFEDLIEIGRQDRPDIYALRTRRVPPLVPPRLRIGVRERRGPRGETMVALTDAEVRRTVARVRRSGAEAVAIGLLHAYAYPAHERRLARALRAAGFAVTASSEISPEFREYERFATTVANAYLLPRVSRYIGRLAAAAPRRLEIVLSHGGTAPPARAAREPVRQLLSGPAAGVRAAAAVAASCGFQQSLTLDVGGTSTDVAFIDREPVRRRGREVAGFPIQLPMLDVHTVGAGGGSIAALDAGGLLHVGPESAGADPGPACYGSGGPATVTDAMVVLGRIPGDSLAGGTLALDREAAARAMHALARALGARDARAAAAGVLAVTNAHMEAALRRVSIERGHDPREAALVAFGGAGGLHACALAAALDARTVLFPRHAGVLSALGALTGGSRREKSRSVLLDATRTRELDAAWRALERAVNAEFTPAERGRVRITRHAEVRYAGQSHELSVEGGPGLVERFHRAHERRYGFATRTARVAVVTAEVRGALPGEPLPRGKAAKGRAREADVFAWSEGRRVRAAHLHMEFLAPGARVAGPAIVAESGATLWVAPGWRGVVHRSGTLVLTRGRG
jgi:N-methylhydantoinase A